MPAIVSLHASSIWPISIDFTVFKLFLEGCTTEEVVEILLSLGEPQEAANISNSHHHHHGTAPAEGTKKVTFAPITSGGDESRLAREDKRALDEDHLPITEAVSVSAPVAEEDVIAQTEKTQQAVLKEMDEAGTAPGKEKRPKSKMKKKKKASKKNTYFFLNKDYLDFQRRIQMLEGLPSSDAAVLNSRLLYEEVCEQFELYEILIEDGLLFAPHSFLFNQYIPFPMDDRKAVIELYYAVDDCACYHYFGNKMSRYDHMEFSASNEKTGFFSRLLAPPAGRVSVTEKQTPTHIVEQLVKLREGSVRRQWENLKRVCTTISMMYQGKGGLFAPRDIPLIQLVQQCFGLSNKSLLSYASMAFGFEHRLETDMFCHLRSFEEIASVCTLIAGMWCDESQLLLKKDFVEGCKRLARVLEDNRFLGELHLLLFGELMRNKWQVQFDEVQRAITTTNNNNSNNINLAGNPGTASFVQFPTNTNPPNVYLSRLEEHSQPSQPAPSEGTSSMLSPTYMGSPSSPTANSNLHSTMNQGGVASANKMFSRRFLLEFLFIMKNMARLALSIGNGSINGALDIYYGRLFMTLESLSLRTPHTVSVTIPGPTVVTTLVNSTGAVTTEEEVHPPPSPKPAEAESHSPPPAHTRSISMDAIHMDSPGKAKHEINVVPKPMKRVSSLNADDAPLPRRTLVKSASAPYLEGSFNSTLMEPSPSDVLDALEPLACIVNTSLAHPATALLNFGNTSSSLLPRNTSSSFIPDENDLHILGDTNTFSDSHTSADGPVRQPSREGEDSLLVSGGTCTNASVTLKAVSDVCSNGTRASLPNSGVGAGAVNGLRNNTVSQIVRKALDKRYLRELCLFLGVLPTIWPKVPTPLSDSDRSLGGRALSDVCLTLKAITQMLMASDDYS